MNDSLIGVESGLQTLEFLEGLAESRQSNQSLLSLPAVLNYFAGESLADGQSLLQSLIFSRLLNILQSDDSREFRRFQSHQCLSFDVACDYALHS